MQNNVASTRNTSETTSALGKSGKHDKRSALNPSRVANGASTYIAALAVLRHALLECKRALYPHSKKKDDACAVDRKGTKGGIVGRAGAFFWTMQWEGGRRAGRGFIVGSNFLVTFW